MAAAGSLAEDLRRGRTSLRTGPFVTRIRTSVPAVVEGLALLYPPDWLSGPTDFADFHVAVERPAGLRRWFRPQIQFSLDGYRPFTPLPFDQAFPSFEWGLNYSIGMEVNQYLIIHAAAIERGGRVAILPGEPGAGKSTLTAALVHRGWRLLSDELALIGLDDGRVTPLARPINLKNASIGIIRRYVADAVMSPEIAGTVKGTVALLRAPADSTARVNETAAPAWVVFPKWQAGAPARFEERSRASTLVDIGGNAVNYSVHGAAGFAALARVVDACLCFDFCYGELDDAVAAFADLAGAN